MDVDDLIAGWETRDAEPVTVGELPVRLTVRDAARLAALEDLYPTRGRDALVRDLLACALDAVETALPSVDAEEIVSETDEGEPLYAQDGPAVRFRERCEHHAAALAAEAARDLAP